MSEEEPSRSGEEGCSISVFDYSVENHLKAVDLITDLCGEGRTDIDKTDIKRLSSSVTFLRSVKSSSISIMHAACIHRLVLYREKKNTILLSG